MITIIGLYGLLPMTACQTRQTYRTQIARSTNK